MGGALILLNFAHFAEFSQQLLLSPFLGQEPGRLGTWRLGTGDLGPGDLGQETWDVARVTRLPAPEPGVALVFLASKSNLSHVQLSP